MSVLSNRNHMLDVVKAVAAIGVVLVHFPFPGAFGKICASVGVVGVILFFLISGYQSYCEEPGQRSKILRRFRQNLKLTAAAVGIHFLFTVAEQLAAGTLGSWAGVWLADPMTYVRMLILGDFSFIHGDHLWYMAAMLYAYLILFFMETHRLHRIFYKLLPLLLLLRIVMETYTNSFSHFSWLDWHFSGNFLVGALPVMLLGSYIRSREAQILATVGKTWLPGTAVFLLLVFVTVNVRFFGMDLSQPFKIAAAVWVLLLALMVPLHRPVAVLGTVGSRYNLHIYLWHFLIGVLLQTLLSALGAAAWILQWCLPLLVIAASVAAAAALTALFSSGRSASRSAP